MKVTLRTPETQARYDAFLAQCALQKKDDCLLCIKPAIAEFTHWKVVDNSFPCDRIMHTHHMIIPKRCEGNEELITEEERTELLEIKRTYINDRYEFVTEATPSNKSIPRPFHLHLMVIKEGAA